MAHPRPPLPPGPYLVVGLARSGVAAALALRAARPGRASRRLRLRDDPPRRSRSAERLARAGVEVHLEYGWNPRSWRHRRRLPRSSRAPGSRRMRPSSRARAGAGIEVIGELELGWRLVPNEFIAVTGTNGKTTTVELIGAMHRAAGVPVAVAGNVGTPVSSLAGALDPAATVVCEASSFQLEDSTAFAPEVAVFLNFSEDHLDRHGDARGLPRREAAHLRQPGAAGRRSRGARSIDAAAAAPVAHRAVRSTQRPDRRDDVRLRGPPQPGERDGAPSRWPWSAASTRDAIGRALRDFRGVAHRFEHVAEIDGVDVRERLEGDQPERRRGGDRARSTAGVHAILGGSLKGGGFDGARAGGRRALPRLLPDRRGGRRSSPRTWPATGVELVRCGDLERAVLEAAQRARPGEVVLLAPACASFDQYRDYEERGEHFTELVRRLVAHDEAAAAPAAARGTAARASR